MNEITYKKQMIKEMNQLHAEHGLEKPEKAQKSPVKPRKARSPKRPKARKPQSSKARVLTSKPDPKAQEPSPARNNTSWTVEKIAPRHKSISLPETAVKS